MGRFLLGVGLLAGIFAVGIWINSYIGSICEPMERTLQQASTQSYAEGVALIQQARQRWQRHQPLLAVFFDHTPMDRIDECFAQLAVCQDTEDFRATCAILSRQLAALNAAHRPTIENIL